MIIDNISQKIKHAGEYAVSGRGLTGLIMVLLAVGAFGLGRLSKTSIEGNGILLRYSDDQAMAMTEVWHLEKSKKDPISPTIMGANALFGSKNGTKYYTNTCSGASRIKEENKIFFASEKEAREAGYEKSATCK